MKKTVVLLLITVFLTTIFSPFSVMAADSVFCQPGLSYNLEITGTNLSTAATDYGDGYFVDNTTGNRTLLFDIDDSVINKNTSFKNVLVTIDYLDSGDVGKYFIFEYDAHSNTQKRAELYAEMKKENTKSSVTYRLEDAYFGNRLSNKADFSIVMPKMDIVYFYKITVDILDEEAGVELNAKSDAFGNIFFDDSNKEIHVTFRNLRDEDLNLDVSYKIVREFGDNAVISQSENSVNVPAGTTVADEFVIPDTVLDYANYILYVEATNAEKNIKATTEIPFSVCTSVSEYALNPNLGIGAHFNWDGGRDIEGSMKLLKKVGFSHIREGYSWSAFETVTNGERSYKAIDVCTEYIDKSQEKGFTTLVMAGYSNVDVLKTIPEEVAAAEENGYTINSHYVPITDKGREAYINYILEVLRLYDGKIETVEIWNEPNLAQYSANTYDTTEGIYHYAELLRASYSAIKTEFPHIKVAGPVISTVMSHGQQWLDAFMAIEDIHQYYDVFSLHNYSYWQGNLDNIVTNLLDAKAQIPEGKEIIITEFGVTSEINNDYMGYEYQAACVARYYLAMAANDIADKYYIYQFSHENTRFDSKGIVKAHTAKYPYTAKPAFLAVANVNKRLSNSTPVGYEKATDRVKKLTFEDTLRDTTTYVLFTDSTSNEDYTIADTGKKTEFFDMYGNKLDVTAASEGYVINVTRDPVYAVVHNTDSEDIEVYAKSSGDEIKVYGTLKIANANESVALKVFDKEGSLIYVNQTNINESLNFEFDFIPLSTSDVYTINLGNVSFNGIYELTLNADDLSSVSLTALDGEALVTTLERFNAANKVTVKASFNDAEQSDAFNIVIGYYKNNGLVKSRIVKNTDMTYSDGAYTYDLAEKEVSADTVKIFLVNSFNNLKPLTKSIELE